MCVCVATRVLSQQMLGPIEGTEMGIKRVMRYLQKYPPPHTHTTLRFSGRGDTGKIRVWTNSDWAGGTESRRSCSGGWVELEGSLISLWSKLQSNTALSSGEADLNAAVKGISEGTGVVEIYLRKFPLA